MTHRTQEIVRTVSLAHWASESRQTTSSLSMFWLQFILISSGFLHTSRTITTIGSLALLRSSAMFLPFLLLYKAYHDNEFPEIEGGTFMIYQPSYGVVINLMGVWKSRKSGSGTRNPGPEPESEPEK